MKTYHELHYESKYHNAIMYSFGFNTYYSHLNNINQHIQNGKMNYCSFTKNQLKILK